MSIKTLATIMKCSILIIIQLRQTTMMTQKKLVIGKTKDENSGVAIRKFERLNLKVYLFLKDNNIKYKKVKKVNRNVVAATGQIQCKGVLLNNKCLKHPMNRIQSKDHRIRTKFRCVVLITKYIFKAIFSY